MLVLGVAYVFQPPKALALSVYAAVTIRILWRDIQRAVHNWMHHVQIFHDDDTAVVQESAAA